MKSGWPERNRIKSAVERGMTILGDHYGLEPPARTVQAQRKGLGGLFRRPDAARRESAYGFLRETRGWTAGQIGLAYALTEPSLASVRVRPRTAEALESLAQAVEREMPRRPRRPDRDGAFRRGGLIRRPIACPPP